MTVMRIVALAALALPATAWTTPAGPGTFVDPVVEPGPRAAEAPDTPRTVRRRLHRDQGGTTGCAGDAALVTDRTVRQAPAMAEPAARARFRDPAFGSCLARVTDRDADLAPGDTSGGLKNEYSRVQAYNADGSRLLIRGTAGTWYLYDAATLAPIRQVAVPGTDPRWHGSDPDLMFYSDGTSLHSIDVTTGETSLVHDFAADLPGYDPVVVWTRYEGSPSADGRWWGLMAEDQEWMASALLVYDLASDAVTATRDLRGLPGRDADNVTISLLGNFLVAEFDPCEQGTLGTDSSPCGLMVWDRGLAAGRGLVRNAGHGDVALDASGRELFVFQDNDTDHISMADLASGTVTLLLPLDFSLTHPAIGLHISGRGVDRPGWVVVSTHDGAAASHTWMDDQVFLLELVASPRAVRLAHTRSVVDETMEQDYWAEPHASGNHDLTRVLFTTNWGRSGTEEVETVQIELPADWPARLP